jgi:hypothetical protein
MADEAWRETILTKGEICMSKRRYYFDLRDKDSSISITIEGSKNPTGEILDSLISKVKERYPELNATVNEGADEEPIPQKPLDKMSQKEFERVRSLQEKRARR